MLWPIALRAGQDKNIDRCVYNKHNVTNFEIKIDYTVECIYVYVYSVNTNTNKIYSTIYSRIY